jgi:hypothetical protein
MTRPASRIAILLAIACALGGAALIVARAPRPAAGPTPSAAYGH